MYHEKQGKYLIIIVQKDANTTTKIHIGLPNFNYTKSGKQQQELFCIYIHFLRIILCVCRLVVNLVFWGQFVDSIKRSNYFFDLTKL